MKKLFLIAFILMVGTGLMAQRSTDTQAFTADTLINGDTTNMVSTSLQSDWIYSFQVIADELTGTSTLTGLLQWSNDNVNWTTDSSADTLSLTDDGSILWEGVARGRYLRANVIQTGTATASIFGTLILKTPIVINRR